MPTLSEIIAVRRPGGIVAQIRRRAAAQLPAVPLDEANPTIPPSGDSAAMALLGDNPQMRPMTEDERRRRQAMSRTRAYNMSTASYDLLGRESAY